MNKAARERWRRQKRADVKTKTPVLVLHMDGPRKARLTLCNLETGVLVGCYQNSKIRVTLQVAREGVEWVHGWHGEIPDAFRARALLVGHTTPAAAIPATWQQRADGAYVCTAAGVGGNVGDLHYGGPPGSGLALWYTLDGGDAR